MVSSVCFGYTTLMHESCQPSRSGGGLRTAKHLHSAPLYGCCAELFRPAAPRLRGSATQPSTAGANGLAAAPAEGSAATGAASSFQRRLFATSAR
jgi:hypothetical protein